jgi:glycosyltransferase involved in cell wall biosynthesis
MNPSSRPLVSVLTPVYNGADYLAECIESVLAQGYSHWEHLILNNQSTDGTAEIARSYEARDPRIRVLETDRFVSAWENHHIAFRSVSPEAAYVKVVHADDWLFPTCLEQMVELAEANPNVGMVSAYRLDDTRVSLTGLPYHRNVFPGREIARSHLLTGHFVFGTPSSIMLRAEVVRERHPYFDNDSFPRHADTAACLDILQEWDFGFVHQVLTYTRRHPDSLSTQAVRMNTYVAENLKMLKTYGPVFLDPDELEARLERRLLRYHRMLARSLAGLPDREFWRFHTTALRDLEHPLSYRRLLKGLLLELGTTTPVGVLKGLGSPLKKILPARPASRQGAVAKDLPGVPDGEPQRS